MPANVLSPLRHMMIKGTKCMGRDLNPRSLSGLCAGAAVLWILSPVHESCPYYLGAASVVLQALYIGSMPVVVPHGTAILVDAEHT